MTSIQSIILAMILIIICIYMYRTIHSREDFATKNEKAQVIYNWFSKNKSPKYIDYKRDLKLLSNIVEYEDILSLSQRGLLTIGAIMSVL